MQGATHRDLTRAVAAELFPRSMSAYVDEVARAASLPDEVADVVAGSFGTKIAGHTLAGLDHFCVPTDRLGHYRGYNWHLDKSLCHAVRRFDPRVGDVDCRPLKWFQVVGQALALSHPLIKLIRSLDGKATLDADNVTFPTAAIMAEWVWKVMDLGLADPQGPPPAKVVGCVCHFIQDACVPHHSRGWLLKGHAKTEAEVQRVWAGDADVRAHVSDLVGRRQLLPIMPRNVVEIAAASSCDSGREGAEPEVILSRAVIWTARFLGGTVLPMVQR